MTSALLDWLEGLSWSGVNPRGALWAVVATLALLGALKLLAVYFGRLRSRLESEQTDVRVNRWELSAEAVRPGIGFLVGLCQLLAAVALIDIYLVLVLRLFSATEPLAERYLGFVVAPFRALYTGFVQYIPNLFYILVVTTVTLVALKFLHLLSRGIAAGKIKIPGFYTDWAETTYKLLRALTLMFLLIAIFPDLPGADEQAFKAVSIFVGALVTLGSTAAVGNAVAGVVLVYTRAFQLGDWITVGKTTGEVSRRTLLVTRLRNSSNEQVTIPNGEVLREHVVNYSPAAERGLLAVTLDLRVPYGVDGGTVEELLLKAAAATPGISGEEAPWVMEASLDDLGVTYHLRACTHGPPPLGLLRSRLARNVRDAFDRAGIELLTPRVSVVRSDSDG